MVRSKKILSDDQVVEKMIEDVLDGKDEGSVISSYHLGNYPYSQGSSETRALGASVRRKLKILFSPRKNNAD